MSSALVLVVLLLAVGLFSIMVVRRRTPGDPDEQADHDQLRWFVYVGAIAAGLLALLVIMVEMLSPVPDRADTVALLGFFGFCAYQLAAFGVVLWRRGRFRAPRAARRPRHSRR